MGELRDTEPQMTKFSPTKADLRAQRLTGCQNGNLVHWKVAFCKDVQHFAAHIACGTRNNDAVTHLFYSNVSDTMVRGFYTPGVDVERGFNAPNTSL